MTRVVVVRSVIATITVVAALAVASAASAVPPSASVTSVSYKTGSGGIDLVVAIPKAIDTAARTGNANWGLDATVTYVDQNGGVQTLDSGRIPIANTRFLSKIDSQTDTVAITIPFNGTTVPGSAPSYSTTATLITP
jgi:hypothetical protein